jgi:Flp pilus assembly protein TadD
VSASSRDRAIIGSSLLLAVAVGWWLTRSNGPTIVPRDHSGIAASPSPTFVDRATCVGCHAGEAEAWRGSHHDLAMQEATEETVLGDFGGATFTHEGVTSTFSREGDRFVIRTDGADGDLTDFEVAYTFGVEPLQQYLVKTTEGRVQCLPVAWDTKKERWFHVFPDQDVRAGDPMHWSGRYQRWNLQCAECHSTNLSKGYRPETDGYETTWSEIDVSCQACHGPGSAHVAWAKGERGPHGDAERAAALANKGLVVGFHRERPRYEVDQCARCHARRHAITVHDERGRPFLDDFVPARLRQGLYHADGQILDEVYVYGSFLQSRMYHQGVRCTDCHDPHSLRPRAAGNAICTQCHQPAGNPRFPTLQKAAYDNPEHTHHAPGSPGALCINCHMPSKTYMEVDPRRDHSFRVPRPDLTEKLGTPNACNACHTDRSAGWASRVVAGWYGTARREQPHYGETLDAARAGRPAAGPALAELATSPEQPAIVRATALDHLAGYGPVGARAIVTATRDEDALVRSRAVAALAALPTEARLAVTRQLVSDPVRAVRIEAALLLAPLAGSLRTDDKRRAFDAALEEYRTAQRANADQPDAHLNLGALAESLGHAADAERSYRKALGMDAAFHPARFNLAALLAATDRPDEAEILLREGLALEHTEPEIEGELHYALGLLLAERNRLTDATLALEEATRKLPGRARVHRNLGLAFEQLGRDVEAERALERAGDLGPADPGIAEALTHFYARRERWQKALPHAERWAKLTPESPVAQRALAQIREALRR